MRAEDRRPQQPERPSRRLLEARCEGCGEVLAASIGCTADPYPTALPWGSEPYFAEEGWTPKPRCPDCAARVGHSHHWDCIRAMCGICDELLYMCVHGEGTDDG